MTLGSSQMANRVSWLNSIPEHWTTKRLKFIASCNDEVLAENTDPDYIMLYVDISNVSLIEGIKHADEIRFEVAPSRARRRVRDGDIIVSTVRTYLKAIALISKPPENLIVSTGFAVLRPKNGTNSKYLGYVAQTNGFVGEVVSSSIGVSYPAIDSSTLVTFSIPLPPIDEQHAIAAFLDHKTGQIDSLIDKKRRMIELLKEKRTALISHAVTKGLNPDAPMKDSGVPWLGQVPAHWEVKKVAWLMDINSGEALPNELIEREPDESNSIPVYGGNGIMGYTGQANVFKQKLIIGRVGAHCGNVHLSQRIGWITDNALVATVRSEAILDYLFGALKVLDLNRLAARNAQPLITGSLLKQQYIPIPPKSEQQSIVEYVNRKSAEMTGLHEKTAQAIDSLKEYRAAMITAAVTGQIDVRNHGAA